MAIKDNAITEHFAQQSQEIIPKSLDLRHPDPFTSQLACSAKTNIQQNILRPRTPTAFVASSVDKRLDVDSVTNVQSANSLRRVDLVACYRQQVRPQVCDVGRDLSYRLSSVRVEEDTVFSGDLGNLRDGLYCSHFVVGVHDGDEDGALRHGLPDVVGIHHSRSVNRQIRHFSA